VLNFINEITPLQDKASLSIFTREEASDQPFVFVYDVDDSNRLVVIDAHDIYIVLSMDYLLYILLFPLPIHFHFLYRLILCDGSDKFPFILSMTSKALLSVLLSASSSLLLLCFTWTLHLHVTKMNFHSHCEVLLMPKDSSIYCQLV